MTWREVGENMGGISKSAAHGWAHPEKKRAQKRAWDERSAEHRQQYRKANKGRIEARRLERRAKDPVGYRAARAAISRRYYWKNVEGRRAYSKRWHEENAERVKESRRGNRTRDREYLRQWRLDNPEWRGEYRSALNYGPEWGPVHRALCDLRAAIKERTDK